MWLDVAHPEVFSPSLTAIMASEETVAFVDSGFPVAQLETISYEALRDNITGESVKLFEACCRDGIFYLDMAGTETNISEAVSDIYMLEREIFNLSEEELMCFDIDKLSPRKLNGFVGPKPSILAAFG